VIETVSLVAGTPVPTVEEPRRAGDPPELVAEPSRARDVLGWIPKYAELQTIVEHAWAWHTRGD
jgi:UDP-glucose 4-epimerase